MENTINSIFHNLYMQRLRKQRLRDVEERRPTLPKFRKIVFFAPHSSEHPAVLPVIKTLSKRLQDDGFSTETHTIGDMKVQVRSISSQLAGMRLSKMEKSQLDAFFRMNDALRRSELLSDILTNNPEANVLEMHALPEDYQYDDKFPWIPEFFRIPGTRILFLKDLMSEYMVPLEIGIAALKSRSNRLAHAVSLLNLNYGNATEHLKQIRANLTRMLLVEIPASAEHDESKVHTSFERSYGLGLSMQPTLRVTDIWKLHDLLTS
jgi:hypothetical protein